VFGGYRVQEQFGGDTVEHTAVGRTPAVSGTMQIGGPQEAGPGRDVRNVGNPGLIGTAGDELSLGQIQLNQTSTATAPNNDQPPLEFASCH
jgi:hypothetical protein